jgi:hypothetical protein
MQAASGCLAAGTAHEAINCMVGAGPCEFRTSRTSTAELTGRLMGASLDSLTVRHPPSSSLPGSLSAGLRDVGLVPPPVARALLRVDFWTQPRHIQQHRFTVDGVAGSVAPVCDTHATEVDTGNTIVARHCICSTRAAHAHLLCRYCSASATLACCADGRPPLGCDIRLQLQATSSVMTSHLQLHAGLCARKHCRQQVSAN